jgi:hypothetical protein
VGTAAPHHCHARHPQAIAGRSTPFLPNFSLMVCMAASMRLNSCRSSRRNDACCALMALPVSGKLTGPKSLRQEPMSHRLAVEDFRSCLLHLGHCCCHCCFSSTLELVLLGEITSVTVCCWLFSTTSCTELLQPQYSQVIPRKNIALHNRSLFWDQFRAADGLESLCTF